MKSVKLFIVFSIILAAVIGVFFLMTDSKSGKLFADADNTIEKYRKDFENDWNSRGDWDKDIFMDHHETIKQLGNDYPLDELKNLDAQLAIELVKKKSIEEWESNSCRSSVIDKYMEAIDIITNYAPQNASHNNVQLIKNINGVYRSALALANTKIMTNAKFTYPDMWSNYDVYKSSILQKKQNILNNTTYKTYLENIDEIKTGLDAIDGKLSNGKHHYYNSLAHSIMNCYANKDFNSEELTNLANVCNKFKEEYGGENNDLNSFYSIFRQQTVNPQ
ncbi:MAG: hypothetical protein SOZ80_02400 [Prevotella sp.]|uniref:hypothetical protein n=1 Tax=Prevotella sp. TaxID=59823 RepID=UPI002A25478D|nr:hypothetical protein [Prevotella sp.]MDD7319106.1 hypothetical protein [Prevotellaceae bacterium]MDY4019619.1 hypothetical protein [Prevotella sp.]